MLPPVPFHGRYQAGILPKPRPQTAVISFNTTADGRAELTDLFRAITTRARFLTAGGIPPPTGIGGPPSDSGVLGPAVVPDGERGQGAVSQQREPAEQRWPGYDLR